MTINHHVIPVQRDKPERSRGGRIHQVSFQSTDGSVLKVFLTINTYPDGHPCEIFLNASKQGSVLRGLFDALAILISNALQWGIPLEAIAHALADMKFEPALVVHHPDEEVPEATSPVDWIVKRLLLAKEAATP